MKFSENWLREWINPTIDSSILYNQIINSGIEIDSVKNIAPLSKKIVVGKIVSCTSHISSDQLNILKVNIGTEKLLNIVCRASNCRIGMKVAVATIGTVLPNKMVIKKRIINGEVSEGMLCSFSELGLFESIYIIEIDRNITLGRNIEDIFLLKDNIIKISTTPNRSDGLNILGLARDVAVINNLPAPIMKLKSNPIDTEETFLIDIPSNIECMYFSGRIVKNVNLNIETPFWMKKKLFFCDLLSDNIITNIINYVLIELGQPLFSFDADKINDKIILRMANNQDDIFLKDKKIHLNENILIITDIKKILFIPGNIYSNTVEIKNNSQNIFLGTALFSKKIISDIIKKFHSNKILEYYHYGIDSLLQNYALEYATQLIIQICGGLAGPIVKKESTHKNNKKNIKLHHNSIKKISGIFISRKSVADILERLHYTIISFQEKCWTLISPSWRFDILIEEDVISDILRIYGYNNIFLTPLKDILIIDKKNVLKDQMLLSAKNILVSQGYYEVITYSFIDPKIHNILFYNDQKLLISNPISQDMSCMRRSLWPGLIKTISYNKNRSNRSLRFFESGLCFSLDKQETLGVKQELFLGAVISGNYTQENWYSKTRKMDFYDLKGNLESILELTCGLDAIEFRQEKVLGLHPQQSATIYLDNNFIGSIGAIDPTFEKELDISESTFIFEIMFNNVINPQKIKINEISRFPASRRDISILISEEIAIFKIIKECKHFFINEKVEINLFDVYSFTELHQKNKSIGISFIFQDYKKTLKDNEINFMLDGCIKALNKKFQIIVRKQNDGTDKS